MNIIKNNILIVIIAIIISSIIYIQFDYYNYGKGNTRAMLGINEQELMNEYNKNKMGSF